MTEEDRKGREEREKDRKRKEIKTNSMMVMVLKSMGRGMEEREERGERIG